MNKLVVSEMQIRQNIYGEIYFQTILSHNISSISLPEYNRGWRIYNRFWDMQRWFNQMDDYE